MSVQPDENTGTKKLSPVTAEQQAAFKAEMPVLRKAVKSVNRDCWKSRRDLVRLKAQAATCRVTIDHWESVLMVGRKIRSPVRLWDTWNKIRVMADDNEKEIERLERLQQ